MHVLNLHDFITVLIVVGAGLLVESRNCLTLSEALVIVSMWFACTLFNTGGLVVLICEFNPVSELLNSV